MDYGVRQSLAIMTQDADDDVEPTDASGALEEITELLVDTTPKGARKRPDATSPDEFAEFLAAAKSEDYETGSDCTPRRALQMT